MKTLFSLLIFISIGYSAEAQSLVGNWKKISHMITYDGQTFDSYAALLSQRPCAAKIVYRITSDGNYRLDASASDCDESYKNIQQRLYAKNKWRLEGNKLSLSASNFAVSQDYTISFSGDKMIWKQGADVITYQKLP